MPFFKFLLFSLLFAGFSLRTSGNFARDCNSLQVSYEVRPDVLNKFEIIVTVTGAVNSLEYLFYSAEGSILNKDLSENSVKQISKGKYFCLIRDKGTCSKTIEIEIK